MAVIVPGGEKYPGCGMQDTLQLYDSFVEKKSYPSPFCMTTYVYIKNSYPIQSGPDIKYMCETKASLLSDCLMPGTQKIGIQFQILQMIEKNNIREIYIYDLFSSLQVYSLHTFF